MRAGGHDVMRARITTGGTDDAGFRLSRPGGADGWHGVALAEAYPAARAVFDEVDEALGTALSALIAEGPEATLTLTENAQPALMATSLAALGGAGVRGPADHRAAA